MVTILANVISQSTRIYFQEESYRPSKPFTLPNIPRQAICPKCSKAVYEAEKILAAGGVCYYRFYCI